MSYSQAEFDAALLTVLSSMSVAQITSYPGVMEILSEELNNDVLSQLNIEQESCGSRAIIDSYPGGHCPDCGQDIPLDVCEGEGCDNCDHVFYSECNIENEIIDCQLSDGEQYGGQAKIKAKLDYLRGEIKAERISYEEIVELQFLVNHIDDGDFELLEWAGVKEELSGLDERRRSAADKSFEDWGVEGVAEFSGWEWSDNFVTRVVFLEDPDGGDSIRRIYGVEFDNHTANIKRWWDES